MPACAFPLDCHFDAAREVIDGLIIKSEAVLTDKIYLVEPLNYSQEAKASDSNPCFGLDLSSLYRWILNRHAG